MSASSCADSKVFFDCAAQSFQPQLACFLSLRGRARCLILLFKKIASLPFVLAYKTYQTSLRLLGLLWSVALLFTSLGFSQKAREFFLRRVTSLTKDLADWVLFPFSAVGCLSKLLIAAVFHPAVYFKF